ncbi:unnamed protein product [Heligmosomoides polygyrus]|uniref:Uncharacterized protein n=1 Tax=Heligmosomoides polygyrus TaxID=6339 RepID=A0A183G560_HELPZ|nr:unnamed protein product [Heligmosomoides polygyrus]
MSTTTVCDSWWDRTHGGRLVNLRRTWVCTMPPSPGTYTNLVGKVHKLSSWVLHDLTERDRQRRAEVAIQLLYKRTDSWVKSPITGDEEWCLCVNLKRSRRWVDKDERSEPQLKEGPSHRRSRKGAIY